MKNDVDDWVKYLIYHLNEIYLIYNSKKRLEKSKEELNLSDKETKDAEKRVNDQLDQKVQYLQRKIICMVLKWEKEEVAQVAREVINRLDQESGNQVARAMKDYLFRIILIHEGVKETFQSLLRNNNDRGADDIIDDLFNAIEDLKPDEYRDMRNQYKVLGEHMNKCVLDLMNLDIGIRDTFINMIYQMRYLVSNHDLTDLKAEKLELVEPFDDRTQQCLLQMTDVLYGAWKSQARHPVTKLQVTSVEGLVASLDI